MNPFDWRGPEFLLFYLIFAIVVILVLSRLRIAREETLSAGLPPISEPYAIAFVRGGQKAMLEVAVFSLVSRGLLDTKDGKLKTTSRLRHEPNIVSDPLDKAVLEFFKNKGEAVSVYRAPEFQKITSDVESRLFMDGILPDAAAKEARSRDYGIAFLLLAGAAGLKVVIALERGRHNILLLIVLAIVCCILAFKVACPRTTKRGEQWLKDLRGLMAPLLDRAKSLAHNLGAKEAAMLAAVFGIAAMPSVAFPFAAQLFPAPDKTPASTSSCGSSSCGSSSSSDSGSSGGSSCGSSCGGGCGGGCGGCGS